MTDFKDGDIIITEHFAVKVTRTGRGWFAEVSLQGSIHFRLLRESIV